MSRLPIPNSDDGTWGNILNDFLGQAHNPDGTLKSSATATAGAEQTSNKGQPSGYAPLDSTGKVPASNLPSSGSTPDATTTTKGMVQLSGDLGGTSAAPTVAALAITDAKVAAANKDGLATVPSLRTLGVGAQQALPGNGLPCINVRLSPYNAKGDGATDDTAALQAALNAAGISGQTVYLPSGRYLTSSSLQLPKFVSIVGEHQFGLLGLFMSPTGAPVTGGTATGSFIWCTANAPAIILPQENSASFSQVCGCSITKLAIYSVGDCIYAPNGAASGFKLDNVGLTGPSGWTGKGIYIRGFTQDWDFKTVEIAGGSYGIYFNGEDGILSGDPSRLDAHRFEYLYVHGQSTVNGPSTTGSITAGAKFLTVSGSVVTAAGGAIAVRTAGLEVRNMVTIAGAGPAGGALVAEIMAISGNTIVLDVAAVTSVSNATVTSTQGGIPLYFRVQLGDSVTWNLPRIVTGARHGIYLAGGLSKMKFDAINFEANGFGGTTIAPTTTTIAAGMGTIATYTANGTIGAAQVGSSANLHIGDTATIAGAGVGGIDLYTVVTSIIDATHITLNDVSQLNVTAADLTIAKYSDMVIGGEISVVQSITITDTWAGANRGDNNLRYAFDLSNGSNIQLIGCQYARPCYDPHLAHLHLGGAKSDILNPTIDGLVRVSPYYVRSGVATLAAGVATVINGNAAASNLITVTSQDDGITGALRAPTAGRVTATSFPIKSSNSGDAGLVYWRIEQL